MPNEPILLKRGDEIYLRSEDNRLIVHMRVALGDKAVHFDIDPLNGERSTLLSLRISLLVSLWTDLSVLKNILETFR